MNLKHLLFAVATLLISSIGFSQTETRGKEDNLLFLLRQTEHINQVLKTIDQLKGQPQSTLKTSKVVIIVCGEAVTSLTTKEAELWVEKINSYPNVSLMACGLSLIKFNKTEKDLIKGVGYTENGLIKTLELQKKGYLSIEL